MNTFHSKEYQFNFGPSNFSKSSSNIKNVKGKTYQKEEFIGDWVLS